MQLELPKANFSLLFWYGIMIHKVNGYIEYL